MVLSDEKAGGRLWIVTFVVFGLVYHWDCPVERPLAEGGLEVMNGASVGLEQGIAVGWSFFFWYRL